VGGFWVEVWMDVSVGVWCLGVFMDRYVGRCVVLRLVYGWMCRWLCGGWVDI